MIGCENHTVVVTDRGGVDVLFQLDKVNLVRWERVRDDISEAVIRVNNPGPSCCRDLADIRTGRHELVIYRGKDRVWEGPISRITDAPDYVEIAARDVMYYAARTIMRQAYSNAHPNTDFVTERARKVMLAEMARKEALSPPINVLPHLDVRTTPTTARTARSTKEYQMYVFDDLDTMAARSGMDYTVVSRRIVLWDVHESIGQTRPMTDSDFIGPVIVTEYGAELCTYSAVTNGEGVWGASGVGPVGNPSVGPYYGEWELLHTSFEEGEAPSTDTTPPSTEELRMQASRNLASRFPTPTVVRIPDSTVLNPQTTAITFDELIPGMWIPLTASGSCRKVSQMQKLDKVRVEESGTGERIMLTLSPAPGSVPSTITQGSDS